MEVNGLSPWQWKLPVAFSKDRATVVTLREWASGVKCVAWRSLSASERRTLVVLRLAALPRVKVTIAGKVWNRASAVRAVLLDEPVAPTLIEVEAHCIAEVLARAKAGR